jgi:hypothetical protein
MASWGMPICTLLPQVPALNIFETSFRRGKFDESRKLSNGGMLEFAHIYPMDAVFDTPEDVPEEVRLLPDLFNHASRCIGKRCQVFSHVDSAVQLGH